MSINMSETAMAKTVAMERDDTIQNLLMVLADQQDTLKHTIGVMTDKLLPILRSDVDVQASVSSLRDEMDVDPNGMVYQKLQEAIAQTKWIRNEIASITERAQL
jgi:hypothetical protein